ncbi:abscisic acid 8'-hydroxylase CYP707A2-like [Andrographis paniculata]|uniref:abscisic acid 8'-hydroxylase CYP707A2-like n=1 Tax=Andrographis paniculata TaxID=175694 RepID=UPI0021E84F87|nr:abscisic acid 8'-hydroxylase CYP707A2-like [Andrographis paniculata]
MEFMSVCLAALIAAAAASSIFFIFNVIKIFRRRRQLGSRRLPLPPGSMGWPYIGETFQLYSQNPNTFFASKIKKYGGVFKSHILGCPCVMVASPEAAKLVLVSKAHLFKPTFPATKERILGKQAVFFHQGPYHAKLRKILLRAFLPDAIRHFVPDLHSIALQTLQSCHRKATITAFHEMKTYAFNVALVSIFGREEMSLYKEDLKRCYYMMEKGYNSMPLNLPGTLFRQAMAARRRLSEIVAGILSSRRQQKRKYTDLLGSFMELELEPESESAWEKLRLSEEQIVDNIIGVMFAARDTTASVLTWLLKYLAENPAVLRSVTEEQEAIMKSKQELEWDDMKKMSVSQRVIQETLRAASILSFTFREAVQDVQFNGYLIPKGWKVLPLFRNIHHNPEHFPDPQKFDPSRFQVAPKPNSFLPFGSGIHSCPGNELAKLEILVLLHHLTTKYRWSMESTQNGIQYGPFALPQNGLPIKLYLRE